MTEVKTIKCEIHCQNGESIHAAFPAVPGIWEREEIYVEVSENRSYGCRYGQIRLNMRQGALRKEANSGIPSNSSEPGENHGNVYAQ